MKVYLTYERDNTYPFAVKEDTMLIFKTYEEMYEYLSRWYDSYWDTKAREELCKDYNFSDWESAKARLIFFNDDDAIGWKELELK